VDINAVGADARRQASYRHARYLTPRSHGRFRRWEKLLFRVFANHAALSIQKTELLAEPAPAEGGLDDTLRFIVEKCAAITDADTCTLQLFDQDNATLEQRAIFQRSGSGADWRAGHAAFGPAPWWSWC